MLYIMGWGRLCKQAASTLLWYKYELRVDLEQRRNMLPSWFLGRQAYSPTAKRKIKYIKLTKTSKCFVNGWWRGDLTDMIFDQYFWQLPHNFCQYILVYLKFCLCESTRDATHLQIRTTWTKLQVWRHPKLSSWYVLWLRDHMSFLRLWHISYFQANTGNTFFSL